MKSLGDHQCGFRQNSSPTDHIFCLGQILEKKWEYKLAVHQLFTDFKKANDSVRREVLYNALVEFCVPMKLVRLIKMCLTETYSRVQVSKNLSDIFPTRNGLKQGDALTPWYTSVSGYADDVNILGGSVHSTSIKENAESLK